MSIPGSQSPIEPRSMAERVRILEAENKRLRSVIEAMAVGTGQLASIGLYTKTEPGNVFDQNTSPLKPLVLEPEHHSVGCRCQNCPQPTWSPSIEGGKI